MAWAACREKAFLATVARGGSFHPEPLGGRREERSEGGRREERREERRDERREERREDRRPSQRPTWRLVG